MSEIVNEEDIQKLVRIDPIFATINQQYGAPPNWSRTPGFVTLCKLILEQQVSLASAHAHFLKLHAYIGYFTPENILMLDDQEMRNCQISRQKSSYLRNLSAAVLDERIELGRLHLLNESEIRLQLTALKGIGNWTADVYLLFCLQQKDVFPIGDIAVINTMKELTAAKTKMDILNYAEQWRPYRSLATYFLWHYYLVKRNRTAPTEYYMS